MVPFLEARAGVVALNTTGNGKIQPYFAGSVGTSVYKDILDVFGRLEYWKTPTGGNVVFATVGVGVAF